MISELDKELEVFLDFYLKQRQNPPADYAYASKLVSSPGFFTIKALQEHLNNPLLNPAWVNLVKQGKSVSLTSSGMFKTVQSNQLQFMDKQFMNQELQNGAAVVLEGVDILDASINAFVARLENELPCSLSNCVAFFSQPGNEAYEGHCDSDDVLVIQLSGKKLWNIYAPQQRRYANTTHLNSEQMGPKIKQITMKPGDALYVRAGVPHMCQTTGDHSLHLAFDLVDSSPSVEQITTEANHMYDHACEEPYASTEQVTQRYASLLQSSEFQNMLATATKDLKSNAQQFRSCIGRSSAVSALSKYF